MKTHAMSIVPAIFSTPFTGSALAGFFKFTSSWRNKPIENPGAACNWDRITSLPEEARRYGLAIGSMNSTILVLFLLLLAAPGSCLADYMVKDVSVAQAMEMGVTVRTEKNGDAGIRVWMEFEPTGKLEEFAYVEVRIVEGENEGMFASLRDSRPSPGNVAVHFSAGPAYLPNSELWIYVNDAVPGGTIYRIKVKDFLEA